MKRGLRRVADGERQVDQAPLNLEGNGVAVDVERVEKRGVDVRDAEIRRARAVRGRRRFTDGGEGARSI